MKNNHKHAKRIRLKDFSYRGQYRYFITIRCHSQNLHFDNGSCVDKVLDILRNTANQKAFSIWAYCFMPDHLHLLIEGQTDQSNMRKFVSLFKQKTGFWFSQHRNDRLWQENYYEHVLRTDEETVPIARYIFENPVRRGFVIDYTQYPHSGSFEFENIDLM